MTIEAAKQLEAFTDGALNALGRYTLQQMHWNRYGKLLLALRNLSLRYFDGVLQNLFKSIINDILIES